jgi:hypothetical protein
MKKLLLTSTLLAGLANAQFDNVGTSAANFLKIGVGSRAEGMGGAYTAQVSDATAMYWNPSGLAHIKQPQVVFNYFDWVADMKYSYMGVTIPAGRTGTFGLSFIYFDMGEMIKTTELEPEGEGTFNASDLAIGFAYGTNISDRFVVGIQAKLIRETISFSNASAFAVDVGSQYLTDFYGLRIGMSVSNFGTKMRLYGTDNKVDVDAYEDLDANPDVVAHLNTDDWSLPMAFRFGLSMTPVGKEGIIKQDLAEVTVNWEYFDPRDFNPYYVLGFEAKVMDMLYLRTGYQFKFRRFSESLDDNSSDEDFQSALDDENGNGYACKDACRFFAFCHGPIRRCTAIYYLYIILNNIINALKAFARRPFLFKSILLK